MAQMEESVESLQLKPAALADPTVETKQWIRCLAINAKNENRMDIVSHLRSIAPAGTTGKLTVEIKMKREINVLFRQCWVSLGNVESGLNEFRNCIQLHPTFLLLWYTIVNSPLSHCLSVIHLYYPSKLSAWTCFFALIAAVLAQSVERVTAQREVAGPIPGAGPILRVLK